jgi:hypothetical protein
MADSFREVVPMALVEMNWNPARRELRQFGGIMLIGCGIVGAVLWLYGHPSAGKVIWVVGAAVGLPGLAFPPAVKPVYLLLSLVSWPVGWVMSYLILGIFYYVIITGTGLVFRLIGRDALQLRFDPNAKTYWRAKVLPGPEEKQRYFSQF